MKRAFTLAVLGLFVGIGWRWLNQKAGQLPNDPYDFGHEEWPISGAWW